MRVLDLFSGIGGFSLGLERAGMQTVAFCEIEPFCRAVLAKHWPGVPCYDDIRELSAARLAADGIVPDLICGGFPCQDISVAGRGAGLDGDRSGLWFEYLRLIGETRPQWVVIENVPALRSRGLDTVLGGLAALGYDAEWHCIPASALGAPHRRDRVWIVAHAAQLLGHGGDFYAGSGSQSAAIVSEFGDGGAAAAVANAGFAHAERQRGLAERISAEIRDLGDGGGWGAEPDVGRVAYGVPSRVDRLRSLGNAVVPQVVEVIGRAIMARAQQEQPAWTE